MARVYGISTPVYRINKTTGEPFDYTVLRENVTYQKRYRAWRTNFSSEEAQQSWMQNGLVTSLVNAKNKTFCAVVQPTLPDFDFDSIPCIYEVSVLAGCELILQIDNELHTRPGQDYALAALNCNAVAREIKARYPTVKTIFPSVGTNRPIAPTFQTQSWLVNEWAKMLYHFGPDFSMYDYIGANVYPFNNYPPLSGIAMGIDMLKRVAKFTGLTPMATEIGMQGITDLEIKRLLEWFGVSGFVWALGSKDEFDCALVNN